MANPSFSGQGIQNTGSGNFHVAGNVNIGGHHHDPRDAEFLKALRVTDPRDDKTRIQRQKGGLLENSHCWLLNHPDFQKWSRTEEARLLWIKGDPGKGKTMLLCGIIDEIKKASHEDQFLSYFFCQAADMRLNTATSVVRGLLYVLLAEESQLISHVRQKFDEAGAEIFQDVNQWDATCKMLESILLLPDRKQIILVIDGLDECVDDRDELLNLIINISTYAGVKVLVSGRNLRDIEEMLTPTSPKVWLSLELNHDSISASVQMYIRHMTDKLAKKKNYNNETYDLVLRHLISNSDNTYLWVALVCQELDKPGVRNRHVESVLKLLPKGLISIYERILENIRDTLDAEYCRQILAITSVVYRPITLQELAVLLPFYKRLDESIDTLEDIVKSCDSLVIIRHGQIYFVHQSAREFLLEKAVNEILPLGLFHQHYAIFSSSLDILSDTLRRDIYGLYSPGTLVKAVEIPDPDPLAAVRYSSVYWIDHLADSLNLNYEGPREYLQDLEIICSFLEKKYLYWLEAISLLHKVPEAVVKMQKLNTLVKSANEKGVKELADDALRFLLFFKHGIQIAPLQVYASALIFSPSKSLVRSLFRAEEPSWIKVRTGTAENWDACIHTLEGHLGEVTSAACSPDQRIIATSSRDHAIKLWDPNTGNCVNTIKGDFGVLFNATFFSDSRRLATFSENRIQVWDLEGACMHALSGYIPSPSSFSLLDGEKYLISGSHDKTLKLWDLDTGEWRGTLKGHTAAVTSVVAPPGSRRFASGSTDRMIKIWDAATGENIQTLDSGPGLHTSLVCTSDGRWLVSTTNSRSIRVWELDTGLCKRSIEVNKSSITSIAMSPDNTRLASSLFDQTIKVWDVATGECRQTLRGHAGFINSVQFLADGFRLVSSSDDFTAKIWDLSRAENKSDLDSSSFVWTVAISACHDLSASGAEDGSIKVWENASDSCIHLLLGHQDAVASLFFLSDRNALISRSYDGTTKVWGLNTGLCLQTFNTSPGQKRTMAIHPNGRVVALQSTNNTVEIRDLQTGLSTGTFVAKSETYSMAFSSDSRWIACGSVNGLIEIWNLQSSHNYKTFQGHINAVQSLSFSADNKWLASGGSDHIIEIWETETWESVRVFGAGRLYNYLTFDPVISSRLYTQLGVVNLDHLLPESQEAGYVPATKGTYGGYGLSLDEGWIVKDGARVLWLPPKYRSMRTMIRDSTVVIGCGTGEVLIMEFSELH